MDKIEYKLKQENPVLFHNNRADAVLFVKGINDLVDKINELVDENNGLKTDIDRLKDYTGVDMFS